MNSGERANIRVLHIDDDPNILLSTAGFLTDLKEMTVTSVSTPTEALEALGNARFSFAIVDNQLGDGQTGASLIPEIRIRQPDITIIGHCISGFVDGADHQTMKRNGVMALANLISKIASERT